MNVNVLLFGISTDLVGATSIVFELDQNATVSDFKNRLQAHYPALSQLNSYAIAVNESYASDDTSLHENDTIAIIPPVSGG
jgi:molybdopterin converting factor subunit 1